MIQLRPLRAIQEVIRRISTDDGRPLRRRWFDPPALSVTSTRAQDLLAYGERHQHNLLVRRHGRARVLAFYERDLWPALNRLPESPERSERITSLALTALGAVVDSGPRDHAVTWAERLNEALAAAAPHDDSSAKRKRATRQAMASYLSKAAALLLAARNSEASRECYWCLRRLSLLSNSDRAAYARLLWNAGDASMAAMSIYARYLDEARDDPWAEHIRAFVDKHVVIDETTPVDQLKSRLLLNNRLNLSERRSTRVARSLVVGYLRLDEPKSALDFITQLPHDGASAFYAGQAYFGTHNFERAAEAFSQAIERGFSRTRVLAWQALALAKLGRYAEAFEVFRDAEEELGSPNLTSEFFTYWGRASFLHGSIGDAAEKFERALALDRNDWRAVTGLALCGRRLQGNEVAIGLLRSHIDAATNPVPGPAAFLLGRLMHDAGSIEQAIPYYRLALRANPGELEYVLALGLALNDRGDAEALPLLERVGEGTAPRPEVFRRLALGYFQAGDRKRARLWLGRLWESADGHEAVLAFCERDIVSQANEALAAGDWSGAMRQFARVSSALAQQTEVRRRHALALTHDATRRLRDGDASALVRTQIDRARAIAPLPETQFLDAFWALLNGDHLLAREQFAALMNATSVAAESTFFRAVCAQLSGEEGADSLLESIAGGSAAGELRPTLTFLQAQGAAARGDYKAAAERLLVWTQNPEAVAQLDLPRPLVNTFAATCLRLGLDRPSTVPARLARLAEQYGNDYWDLASLLVKHHDLVRRGASKVSATQVAECEADYDQLLQHAPQDEVATLAAYYATWLQFLVLVRLAHHEVAEAMDVLSALDKLGDEPSPTLRALRERLEAQVRHPSHEAAFALLRSDAERARQIWETLLRTNEADLEALHHLACWHWTRAWNEVQASRFEESIPSWREGLEYYRRLYASEQFWSGLRDKGRKLVQPGLPFDEAAFDAWQRDAMRLSVAVLLDLIEHIITERGAAGVQLATRLFDVVRGAAVADEIKLWASEELARRRLDPDPAHVADFGASKVRAQQVIDIDPHNIMARVFLLSAAAHRVHDRHSGGERDFRALAGVLLELRPHAEWLFEAYKTSRATSGEVATSLCLYYDELAEMRHEEGYAEVAPTNEIITSLESETLSFSARRSKCRSLESLLLKSRQSWQESDEACRKSLAIEPANFKATHLMERHEKQYPTITSLLTQVRGVI